MTAPQKILRWLFTVLGAASCWWMAFALYQNAPLPRPDRSLPPAADILVLEFILIHSGVLLPAIAASKNRAGRSPGRSPLVLLTCLYGVFGVAISLASGSVQLFATFSGIMISRWTGLVLDPDSALQQQVKNSLAGFILLLGTVTVSDVLGATMDVTAAIYFVMAGLAELLTPLQKSPKLLVFRVVSLAGVMLGLIIAILGARDLMHGYGSRHWPSTNGTIKGSWLRQTYSLGAFGLAVGPQHLLYEANVSYVYQVDGQIYTGHRVTWHDQAFTHTNQAQAVLNRYSNHYLKHNQVYYYTPKNAPQVTIYYAPKNPNLAVLEPGPDHRMWLQSAAGLIILSLTTLALIKAIMTPDTITDWKIYWRQRGQ